MSNTRVEYIAFFRHQTTGTKIKCIDRVYIKVIDRRIRDRMDKMTMNLLPVIILADRFTE